MRKRYILLVSLGAFTALLSQLPLAWIAPHIIADGLGKNIHYSGTIWNGQIKGLDVVGQTTFQFRPTSILKGGLPLKFASQSTAMTLSGRASRNTIKDVRFSGVLAKLPTRDGRLKELAGQVDILVSEIQIKDETCGSAQGQVSTDFLSLNRARWQWQGPKLSGPISCEDGDVIVNLSGRENRQTIRADLRLSKDGSYGANITVQTNQPEAGVVLPLYGFEQQGRDYKLTEQGQWR